MCLVLLTHSIDSNNSLIQNFCGIAKKADCSTLLKSDAAKVWSWLSWSEVGFFYFSGILIALLYSINVFPFLILLNLMSLPLTVYSILFQYKSKNWCLLCCAIQVVLLFEFFITLFSVLSIFRLWETQTFDFSLILAIFLSFLVPILVWGLLKPLYQSTTNLIIVQRQLKSFKYSTKLFKQSLIGKPKYFISDELVPIVLGNSKATTIMTMVSNPFCKVCAKAHSFFAEWLNNHENIQLRLIFANSKTDSEMQSKFAAHAISLYLNGDKKNFR